jgi:hypothetical protein
LPDALSGIFFLEGLDTPQLQDEQTRTDLPVEAGQELGFFES